MKITKWLAVSAGFAALAACGDRDAAENTDTNMVLEENLEMTDNLANVDMNVVGNEMNNADANVDANATDNTANNTVNAY